MNSGTGRPFVFAAVNTRCGLRSLAPACMAAAVRRGGHSAGARVLDFWIGSNPQDAAREILELDPLAVGFSVYCYNLNVTLAIVQALKGLAPDLTVMAGGPEAAYTPFEFLQATPGIDAACPGEGESKVSALARLVSGGGTIGQHLETAGFVTPRSTPGSVGNVRTLPFGSFPLPHEEWITDGGFPRVVYYESSRGCPFSCTFCTSAGVESRQLTIPRVRRDLHRLIALGAETIIFADRTFNADQERANAILEILLGLAGQARFQIEVRPEIVSRRFLEAIDKFPPEVLQIEAGYQTGNTLSRKAIGRPGDPSGVRRALFRLSALGTVHLHCDLMAGLPFQDMGDIVADIDDMVLCGASTIQLNTLKVLPGTAIGRSAGSTGILHDAAAPYQVYSTPTMPPGQMHAAANMAGILNKLYNSGRHRFLLRGLAAEGRGPGRAILAVAESLEPGGAEGLGPEGLREIIAERYLGPEGLIRAIDGMALDRAMTAKPSDRNPPWLFLPDWTRCDGAASTGEAIASKGLSPSRLVRIAPSAMPVYLRAGGIHPKEVQLPGGGAGLVVTTASHDPGQGTPRRFLKAGEREIPDLDWAEVLLMLVAGRSRNLNLGQAVGLACKICAQGEEPAMGCEDAPAREKEDPCLRLAVAARSLVDRGLIE